MDDPPDGSAAKISMGPTQSLAYKIHGRGGTVPPAAPAARASTTPPIKSTDRSMQTPIVGPGDATPAPLGRDEWPVRISPQAAAAAGRRFRLFIRYRCAPRLRTRRVGECSGMTLGAGERSRDRLPGRLRSGWRQPPKRLTREIENRDASDLGDESSSIGRPGRLRAIETRV